MIATIIVYGQIILLFFAFRKKVAMPVLIATVGFLAINQLIGSTASCYFAECYYMFFQAAAVWSFFIISERNEKNENAKIWEWLFFGINSAMLVATHISGLAFVITAVLYWYIEKNNKFILYSVLYFLLFATIFFLYEKFVQNSPTFIDKLIGTHSAAQPVTFSVLVERLLQNTQFYLSAYLLNLFGLRRDLPSITLTLFIIALLVIVLAYYIKTKNRPLIFVQSYTLFGLFLLVMEQDVAWVRWHLIIIFVPLLLISILNAAYERNKIYFYILTFAIFLPTFHESKYKIEEMIQNKTSQHSYFDKIPEKSFAALRFDAKSLPDNFNLKFSSQKNGQNFVDLLKPSKIDSA